MYVPPRKPTETQEQFQSRVRAGETADKYRAMAGQSAQAGRMIRLIVLVICGLALSGAGIHSFSDPTEMSKTEGFGNQHFGPHGNATYITAMGLLILGLSGYFLVRTVRRLPTRPTSGPPTA